MFDRVERELVKLLKNELPNIAPNKKSQHILLGDTTGFLRSVVDYAQSKKIFGRLLDKNRGKISIYPKHTIKFLQETGAVDFYDGPKPTLRNGIFTFQGIKTKVLSGNQLKLLKYLTPLFGLEVSKEFCQREITTPLDNTIKELQREFAKVGLDKLIGLENSKSSRTIKWVVKVKN